MQIKDLPIKILLARGLLYLGYRAFSFIGDMIMKFETLMLRGLFIACMAVCGLIFGAMLTTTPASTKLVANPTFGAILLSSPSSCALPADGVVCPQPRS
jgi:hypothetical protein